MKKTLRSLLSLVMTMALVLGVVAVGGALPVLQTAAETPVYYVIDDCDDTTYFPGEGQQDTAEHMQGQASIRFGNNTTFNVMNTRLYSMTVPENFKNWNVEFWLFLDNPNSLNQNKCTLELVCMGGGSYSWKLNKIVKLKKGWNRVVAPLSAASANEASTFTQIDRVKLTLAATKTVVVRLDDIVLSRETVAGDRSALQAALTLAATADISGHSEALVENFRSAWERAQQVQANETASQREVDVAAERLEDAMNAFGFEGFSEVSPASYGFVDFLSSTYAMMDGFQVADGGRVTYGERETAGFTGQLLVNAAKKQVSAATKDLRFTFTYFDGESGGLALQYGSTDGVKTALEVPFTGRNTWLSATVRVSDAALARSIGGYDIALKATGDITAYVSRVEVKVVEADDITESDVPEFAEQTDVNNIIGAGVFGYQMWFSAGTDGWVHWGEGTGVNPSPGNGNHHTDMYPYVQDYIDNGATLHPSNLENLGNGDKAMLFTSKDPEVVETHFRWMQEYDLDCFAVQRFNCGSQTKLEDADNHLVMTTALAEQYNKALYVMYDVSGLGNLTSDELLRRIATDWVLNVEQSGVVSSSAYAHADGKPVVAIWGISGDKNLAQYPNADAGTRLIRWFKDRGYFVILGSATTDITMGKGVYMEPYTAADMISPWSVARFDLDTWYDGFMEEQARPNREFCQTYGVKYQPVIYPGFSWVAMQNSGVPNMRPRKAGQLAWRQALSFKEMGMDSFYFAMFDEYDEGTAWMKGTSDSFEIPEKDFFLTYAADGQWLSNDYYLRTAQKITQYLKGETTDTALNIPYSQGPVYWRNSFERRWTTWVETDCEGGAIPADTVQHNILANVDVCVPLGTYAQCVNGELTLKEYEGETDFINDRSNPDAMNAQMAAYGTSRTGTGMFRDVSRQLTKTGEWAFQLNGTATADGAHVQYRLAETDVQVSTAGLELQYALYAVNEGGRRVMVDLVLEDGTVVSDLVPSMTAAHGTVGQWVSVAIPLPASLVGRHIVAVAVGYVGDAGAFDAYVDDIVLQSTGTAREMLEKAVATASLLTVAGAEKLPAALVEAIEAAEALLQDEQAGDKQYLAAMKALDTAVRPLDVELPVSEVLYGDVNGDGKVTTADAASTLQYAAELLGDAAIDRTAADVNGDGKVTTADAALILQRCAELLERFPVE